MNDERFGKHFPRFNYSFNQLLSRWGVWGTTAGATVATNLFVVKFNVMQSKWSEHFSVIEGIGYTAIEDLWGLERDKLLDFASTSLQAGMGFADEPFDKLTAIREQVIYVTVKPVQSFMDDVLDVLEHIRSKNHKPTEIVLPEWITTRVQEHAWSEVQKALPLKLTRTQIMLKCVGSIREIVGGGVEGSLKDAHCLVTRSLELFPLPESAVHSVLMWSKPDDMPKKYWLAKPGEPDDHPF